MSARLTTVFSALILVMVYFPMTYFVQDWADWSQVLQFVSCQIAVVTYWVLKTAFVVSAQDFELD